MKTLMLATNVNNHLMLIKLENKVIDIEKIIIVSSIKTNDELPNRLKVIRDSKAYKLFPSKIS